MRRALLALMGCFMLVAALSQLDLTVPPGHPTVTLMSAIHLCLSGRAVVSKEDCDAAGVCARKGMKLEWSGRSEGMLSSIEGDREREVARLSPTRLRMLLDELAVLAPLDTDGGEQRCETDWLGFPTCTRPGPRYRLEASCTDGSHEVTLMRSSLSERMTAAERECALSFARQESLCVARAVIRSTFATRKSRRIQSMIERMEAIAR